MIKTLAKTRGNLHSDRQKQINYERDMKENKFELICPQYVLDFLNEHGIYEMYCDEQMRVVVDNETACKIDSLLSDDNIFFDSCDYFLVPIED